MTAMADAEGQLDRMRGETDVAVVVPVWDAYVRPFSTIALPSILAQESNVSLWVVDNASTEPLQAVLPEDTGAAVIRIVCSDRRLTAGAARNLGLAEVTDPWVVFWDADEAMPPGLLSGLLKYAHRCPSAVVITGEIRHARTGGRYRFPPRWAPLLCRYPRGFAAATMVRLIYPVIGALVRAPIARESGGFADADAGEDWLLGVRLALRGRVRFADAVVREYEPRRGSLSDAGRSIRQVLDRRRALRTALLEDGSVPGWARRTVPLLAVAHAVDVGMFRPMRSALKRLGGQTPREAAPGRDE